MPEQKHDGGFWERRQHPRKKCYAPVRYAVKNTNYSAIIVNISMGGAYIESSVPVKCGQTVTFSVELAEDRPAVTMIGEVVRKGPNGFGVKFIIGIDESVFKDIPEH